MNGIRKTPKCTTVNPAQDVEYEASLEYITIRTECDDGEEMQAREPKTPMKITELATFFTQLEISLKITSSSRLTATMGEKGEGVFEYVLEVLSKAPPSACRSHG